MLFPLKVFRAIAVSFGARQSLERISIDNIRTNFTICDIANCLATDKVCETRC